MRHGKHVISCAVTIGILSLVSEYQCKHAPLAPLALENNVAAKQMGQFPAQV
jgi:hypothetical protein